MRCGVAVVSRGCSLASWEPRTHFSFSSSSSLAHTLPMMSAARTQPPFQPSLCGLGMKTWARSDSLHRRSGFQELATPHPSTRASVVCGRRRSRPARRQRSARRCWEDRLSDRSGFLHPPTDLAFIARALGSPARRCAGSAFLAAAFSPGGAPAAPMVVMTDPRPSGPLTLTMAEAKELQLLTAQRANLTPTQITRIRELMKKQVNRGESRARTASSDRP